jgi:hypothetical protein
MQRERTFVAAPKKKSERDGCGYPDCREDEQAMGGCHTHYQVYRLGVKNGDWTWDVLIELGWARASKRSAYRTILNTVKALRASQENSQQLVGQ